MLRLVRANPDMTFTRLAARTKFERTLTSRIVTRLIRAGLIMRTNSPRDARVFTLKVTPEGEALCAEADALTAAFEALMLQPLSAEERTAFLDMVGRRRCAVRRVLSGVCCRKRSGAPSDSRRFSGSHPCA